MSDIPAPPNHNMPKSVIAAWLFIAIIQAGATVTAVALGRNEPPTIEKPRSGPVAKTEGQTIKVPGAIAKTGPTDVGPAQPSEWVNRRRIAVEPVSGPVPWTPLPDVAGRIRDDAPNENEAVTAEIDPGVSSDVVAISLEVPAA